MGLISSTDARAQFTRALIDVYQERIRPTNFLQSFFVNTPPAAANVSIEVERMGEKVASDVIRGTEGNRNTFSKSTEKIWTPPAYAEYFDITQLALYDRVMGSQGNANENLFASLLNSAAERLSLIQDKIERAKEKMCAEILHSGSVTLVSADSINYNRQAASIVDLNAAGNGGWFSANSDYVSQFKAAGDWMRKQGKYTGGRLIAILGDRAHLGLLSNTNFRSDNNLFSMKLSDINAPRANSMGGVFHGILTAGPYQFEIWTYPQWYDNSSDVLTQYVADNYVYVIPPNPSMLPGWLKSLNRTWTWQR